MGIRPILPVQGVSFILGNDLAGEKVIVEPQVVEQPCTNDNTQNLEEEFPGIFPACAVTRAMSKKLADEKAEPKIEHKSEHEITQEGKDESKQETKITPND